MNFDENNFLDECRFAKVVNTYNGPALLIAGQVIEVRGDSGAFAELIATALRSSNTKRFAIPAGMPAADPTSAPGEVTWFEQGAL